MGLYTDFLLEVFFLKSYEVDYFADRIYIVLSIVITYIIYRILYYLYRKWKVNSLSKQMKEYNGTCHCGKVNFKVNAPRHLVYWDCNCSICFMKKNHHFIVPSKNFQLSSSSSYITEYKFNTNTAKHIFCKICGVQAYYHPRSNPDGIAVTLACVKQEQLESTERRPFDGFIIIIMIIINHHHH